MGYPAMIHSNPAPCMTSPPPEFLPPDSRFPVSFFGSGILARIYQLVWQRMHNMGSAWRFRYGIE
ncbi:hypothetical protein PHO31112_04587 [Pandoraea horticolens]|uniref:Uncharacterized protein n=2 Tax=Pandoraea horticolens TaxID=2508298 RepID=A0A5E4YKX3_9BURK|nr:hypothetical protein PHO31112_04587 [Pandoraea horticolens]